MRLVDTNILLYAVSASPKDAQKRRRARLLLGKPGLGLSVQVLQEFYNQATHFHRPESERLTHEDAQEFLKTLSAFPVQAVTLEVFHTAVSIMQRFRLSYWDSAILAAARIMCCDAVYSEDMSVTQDYGGIFVINPFTDPVDEP